ncbi:hypothetical protein GV791_18265 [Nocardia cyriacigeorgica]|uniref:Cyclic di-GMP-binding protein n=2 Tax=Nocardia cyriacigeorgica TaxID=135487 RepID=H6R3U2_NOCCG|nr:hypothetical protein [Nocardia cyriacigeorgica]NEW34487.1 hypothetical protein [Nocardia cyriacigeorgica]BDT86887.1 hypothetical protein FMUAM8_26510 [Nocardia cyriacigeorgica]CCF63248.1 protein of unknown function [Nocardia cyriacigeorgica GUH-2]
MADDTAEPQTDPPEQSTEPDYFPGERGRRVPRSAWWVLGLAGLLLLVFAVVRPVWFTRSPDDTSLDVPPERHFSTSLADLGRPDGTWLTSDAPSTSFLVDLPVDSARDQTRIQLSGSTQVAEDSTVFLIVSVDGQQIYQRELPRGENPLDDLIDIPGRAAADGQVRVQVRTRGNLHHETCTSDRAAGMVIHLDPATVVEAALDEPIHTVRDAVATWGHSLTLVPTDLSDQWRSTAAELGIALTRAGYEVTYRDELPDSQVHNAILLGPAQRLADTTDWDAAEGLGTEDGVALGTVGHTPVLAVVEADPGVISQLLTTPAVVTADQGATDPQAVATAARTGDAVGLDALGTDLSEAQITESHRWRARYALAQLPGARLPRAVRVAFQLPASPPDLTWLLNVELNGRLVDSRPLAHTSEPFSIPLPPDAQLLDNTLTLTVQRDRDLGGCDVRVSSYPIQLLATSALELGDDPGSGFTAVARELAAGPVIYLPAADSRDTTDLLDAAVPVLARFLPAQQPPQFRWNAEPAGGAPFVLIGDSPAVDTLVHVRDGRLTAGDTAAVLDVSAAETGLVVQCASAPGARGLAISFAGDTDAVALPVFGRECVQVITPAGHFILDPGGALAPPGPADTGIPE